MIHSSGDDDGAPRQRMAVAICGRRDAPDTMVAVDFLAQSA
jgi:hypothetical protein